MSGFDVLANALAHEGVLSEQHLGLTAILLAHALQVVGTDNTNK